MSPIRTGVTLADVARVQSGSAFPVQRQGQRNLEFPFYKVGDMNLDGNEVEMRAETNSISDLTRRELGAAIFPSGSVIFPKVGGAIATNKKRLIVRPACVDNNVMGVIPDPSKIDGRLLFYFFLAHDLSEFANDAGLPSITKTTVENWTVGVVPPMPEQRRIVAILDEAFAGIAAARANAERSLSDTRDILSSHVASLLSAVNHAWAEKSLAEICVVDWGNTSLTKSSYVPDGKFLAVSAAGCDGRIAHKEHAKHTPVLSAIGAQCGRMFFPDEDFTAIKNTITLTPRDGVCSGRFLFRLLTHVDLPKRGAAQPFMAKGDIQAFRVCVPSNLGEQEDIADQIEALEVETLHLESLYTRKLAALDELKQSLLQQAFSGAL